MKVEWLNGDMTEARVTRGWLWWKRVALVERRKEGHVIDKGYTIERTLHWVFITSNRWCDRDVDVLLEDRRNDERTWVRREAMPRVEVRR